MISKNRNFTGTKDLEPRAYEKKHRAQARSAGAGGIVLLKNEAHVLPLAPGSSVALYGAGAMQTIIGGGGSGMVNVRESVTVYQGLKDAGFDITTEEWLLEAEQEYHKARMAYRQEVWDKVDANHDDLPLKRKYHIAYQKTPFTAPAGKMPVPTAAQTAVYVLARNAGEGLDRFCRPGDFLLTADEEATISRICALYENVVFVLNAGGMIDLSFLERCQGVKAVVYMHQPGMEAGHILADVLSGKVPASGKLTDSWAWRYEDYPTATKFSHNDGHLAEETYEEGIFIGYRYFDSFEIPVRYSFGYGLTYASFSTETLGFTSQKLGTTDAEVCVRVKVTNIDDIYSGREVVQMYASCPQGRLIKEFRRLVGFSKTDMLAPGESQELEIKFALDVLGSFDEELPGWVLEQGNYGIFVGNSLMDSVPVGAIRLPEEIVIQRTGHICPLQKHLPLFEAPVEKLGARRAILEKTLVALPFIIVQPTDILTRVANYSAPDVPGEQAMRFVESLTQEQLIQLVTGEITSQSAEVIGGGGIYVPGSGGQTSTCAISNGLASIVFADGPAGLRLQRRYRVVEGKKQPITFEEKFADGFFYRGESKTDGENWYQFCTAIPTGTTLAMTWDVNALETCGHLVAEEMEEFGITMWLAPGINIHRDPLCGRNYEYYSEDPLLSGRLAAAMTRGVQTIPNRYTTIKHMACNNAEDNRMHSDSVLAERTLREIYLRGFELAVRECHPAALMTSYNKINGVHCANNYDICTRAARGEWGFSGIVITDWTTTQQGPDCTAAGCVHAGNDLVMPGSHKDHENLRQELASGALSLQELKCCVARIVELVWRSDWCRPEV